MTTTGVRPALLCVLDGWGWRSEREGNAIAQARTPSFDGLLRGWPHSTLAASGSAVGLPEGQQGNSEVGHLTIGSGRVVLQDLTRIDRALEDGSFFENPELVGAVEQARDRGSQLHLMGLVSPGGVHSSDAHLLGLLELCRRRGLERVLVHAFMDGRDTPPDAGRGFLSRLLERCRELEVGRLASLSGRYYAMDRDHRWDRLERAFRTLVGRPERCVEDPLAYVGAEYEEGRGDEFIRPAAVAAAGTTAPAIADGDVLIHFDFRPDRARELCHALVDPDFRGFDRGRMPEDLKLVTFTRFDDQLPAQVAFPKPLVRNTLAEVVSRAGLRQFHVAETEKYAHVTYFLNGGREQPFDREERLLVPSSKVATYDLQPEMSARAITDAVLTHLPGDTYPLLAVNYANADMVGHTGEFQATVTAVEFLDGCLGELLGACQEAGRLLLVTADHGNAEYKVDPSNGSKLTSHTTSRVPLVLALDDSCRQLRDGGLSDVAPTLLSAMGLTVPREMTGTDLRD